MKVAIAGSSGLIGQRLLTSLLRNGHHCVTLRRADSSLASASAADRVEQIAWDPSEGKLDQAHLAGVDAVVNLCGYSVANRRWNDEVKRTIRESRVQSTSLLASTIASMNDAERPKVFISSSGIGIYGVHRHGEPLDETAAVAPTGSFDFMASVARDWEDACEPAERAGVRVVKLRTAMVLAKEGGALAEMLLPFKLGVGGVIGDGSQVWSWISIDDMVRAIEFALENERVSGAINCASPNAVSNSQFVSALGSALWRPTLLPMPAFAARLAFGEMADELLLSSIWAEPRALQRAKFTFEHERLEDALKHILK